MGVFCHVSLQLGKYQANLEEKGNKLYIYVYYFMLAVGAVRNGRYAQLVELY